MRSPEGSTVQFTHENLHEKVNVICYSKNKLNSICVLPIQLWEIKFDKIPKKW